MITKLKTCYRNKRNAYNSDLDYIGDGITINDRQKRTLINLYTQNIQDEDELYNRISELDNCSSEEAQSLILDFTNATWS